MDSICDADSMRCHKASHPIILSRGHSRCLVARLSIQRRGPTVSDQQCWWWLKIGYMWWSQADKGELSQTFISEQRLGRGVTYCSHLTSFWVSTGRVPKPRAYTGDTIWNSSHQVRNSATRRRGVDECRAELPNPRAPSLALNVFRCCASGFR